MGIPFVINDPSSVNNKEDFILNVLKSSQRLLKYSHLSVCSFSPYDYDRNVTVPTHLLALLYEAGGINYV